jgi:N6-L-threonylcarbamoyladenine synthase
MLILAIESSCDETAVALVENGRNVRANVIASQAATHAATGGVVPEVAAREHIKAMTPTLLQALHQAKVEWQDIDAIAVTKTPGLIGSLVVGRSAAAALSFALDKPLLEMNHVHGHMYAPWLELEEEPEFPILILTVSGGHNELVLMRGYGDFELLGESVDDAAGEAFDKVARLLGLGYPGGPAIERCAAQGTKGRFKFPIAQMDRYDFSFSGLKTAVLYHLQKHPDEAKDPQFQADTALAFQNAVIEALAKKTALALEQNSVKELHLTGGVSANQALRARLQQILSGQKFRFPARLSYCTDNAAMIGAAAYYIK